MAKDIAVDETKWQAEQIVRHKVEKTTEFKKAVRQTISELKKMGAGIKVTSAKKKR